MDKKTKVLPSVKMEDMGLYIQVLRQQPYYEIKDAKHAAELITEHFKVECREIDVLHYEGMLKHQEDFEREHRRIEYGMDSFEKYK
jgi:hypothetical protein|tara:strand:+ start:461 stop:718 length:258 start_codon:yes stop_codon:yes gene_type:complete